MNEYTINDEYGYSNYDYLDSVIKTTLKQNQVKNSIFSIIFVGEKEIQTINRECSFKRKHKSTGRYLYMYSKNDRTSKRIFS